MMDHKPSLGLLVSIAMRLDHSFGIAHSSLGRLRSAETPDQHASRQYELLCDARRAYEEIAGEGFYHPEKEAEYAALVTPEALALFEGRP